MNIQLAFSSVGDVSEGGIEYLDRIGIRVLKPDLFVFNEEKVFIQSINDYEVIEP